MVAQISEGLDAADEQASGGDGLDMEALMQTLRRSEKK